MITHVKLVSIPVSNHDRSLAFYTEKLGFEVVVDERFGDGQRWVELRIPQGQTKIVLLTSEKTSARIGMLSNIVFTVDDIEDTYLKLKAKGVQFKEGLNKQAWGQFTQFSDPDGNTFVLASA